MTRPIERADLFSAWWWSCESVGRWGSRPPGKGVSGDQFRREMARTMAVNAAIGCALNAFDGDLDKAEDHLRDFRRYLKQLKEDKAAQASQN
jgi:hypothetical protein